MCCIMDSSGHLDGNFKAEDGFMVYEHDTKKGMYIYDFGVEKVNERYKTKARYRCPKGWHKIAYFHTHPPNTPDRPSSADKLNCPNGECIVYTIAIPQITRWTSSEGVDSVGLFLNLKNWCITNRKSWECTCPKN